MGAANRLLGLYRPAIAHLVGVIRALGCHRLVDLCAGAGRHYREVIEQVDRDRHWPIRATLTDLHPNLAAYCRTHAEDPRIDYIAAPVDAASVPADLPGFRTLFAGLHHFRPERARRILADSARRGEGIAVFEHTRRGFAGMIPMLFTPLLVWLFTPFIRPFAASRLFWTYVVPVAPLMVLWDGLVSCLRSYTAEELKEFTDELGDGGCQWEVREFRVRGLIPITLLIGSPRHPAPLSASPDAGGGPDRTAPGSAHRETLPGNERFAC